MEDYGLTNDIHFTNWNGAFIVAQVTDQKAEYSMHKGLEYKKCKALLQDALEDHKFLTREEIDKLWWNLLSDVLSDKQKKAKVGNMLTKMREERLSSTRQRATSLYGRS